MKIFAPFEKPKDVIILPDPELGDSRSPVGVVSLKRAMDGTLRTYVKAAENRILFRFFFMLQRIKSLEFMRFYRLYASSRWKIIDWDSNSIVGYVKNNPFEVNITARGTYATEFPEVTEVELEFEGDFL